MASSTSRMGTVHAPEPNAPRSTSVSGRPMRPRCHHRAAAVMMAAHTARNPTPSRWWAGSMSRALRPNARAAAPTVWARAIQMPLSTAAIQPMRMTSGLVVRRAGLRPARLRPRGAGRPGLRRYGVALAPGQRPAAREPDARGLAARGLAPRAPGTGLPVVRARVPLAARGRPAPVPPLVPLAEPERLVPVRGRAALLGARVAMFPTVTRNPLGSKDRSVPRVSRRGAGTARRTGQRALNLWKFILCRFSFR